MEAIVFYTLGGMAVLGSLLVISRKQPVAAVMWLVISILGVAGLFFTLRAEFLGVMQVFLYGDAITVIFLFIIMAMNVPEDRLPEERLSMPGMLAVIASCLMGALFLGPMTETAGATLSAVARALPDEFGSISLFAHEMFQRHFLAFEAVSILLLVAVIGVVILSRKTIVE